MKNPDRQKVTDLINLPNVGRAIARDLRLVGIQNPRDLIGKNAYQLHDELCRITGEKHDPCVIDVFLAVIDFMEGGEPVPWWEFTAERKRRTTEDHKGVI
jgi:hypothetical protein